MVFVEKVEGYYIMAKIAIITARGGSKRIPGKNIKEFLGKPIIAYSIEAALQSGLFEEVMVSTDSEEIAKISIVYGAKVPFMRSDKNSDDYATTANVIKEVLSEYGKIQRTFEWLCCIYPTAPFVTAQKLNEAMCKIKSKNANGLIPVVKFSYPPQRAFIIDEQGDLQYKYPENINKRSQDLQAFYHDAGQFYFARVDKFLEFENLVFDGCISTILNELEVQDIDSTDDWKLAEVKYKLISN